MFIRKRGQSGEADKNVGTKNAGTEGAALEMGSNEEPNYLC